MSIPIGGQPNSLAELVADLERRQTSAPTEDFGDASSVSSVSAVAGAAQSVGSSQSSAAGVTSSPTAAPAAPTAALPGQAPPAGAPTVQPSSLPPAATTSNPVSPPAASSPAPAPPPPPAAQQSPSTAPGRVQNPIAPSPSSIALGASPAPTTLLTLTSPAPSSGGTAVFDSQPSSNQAPGPIATVLPPASEIPKPAGDSANIEGSAPQMNVGEAIGIVLGSIMAIAILGGLVVYYCIKKRNRGRGEDDEVPIVYSEKQPRTWESRLYGSANRSTTGGTSSVASRGKSILVGLIPPWRMSAKAGGGGGEEPGGPQSLPPLPMPPKIGASRDSKRSTGLTTLDDKQYKTYENLVGRSNPKQTVPFDHPYFQRDDWK